MMRFTNMHPFSIQFETYSLLLFSYNLDLLFILSSLSVFLICMHLSIHRPLTMSPLHHHYHSSQFVTIHTITRSSINVNTRVWIHKAFLLKCRHTSIWSGPLGSICSEQWYNFTTPLLLSLSLHIIAFNR